MSYLQVTAARPPLRVPDQSNTLRGSAIKYIAPVNIFSIHNALKTTIGSSKECTKLMTCHVMQRTRASRYQQCSPVCLFGGKGESKNGDEASPWKSMEKAMSSFKKEQSLEDVLHQQMEKKGYYDGGSGEIPPGGGGGGGDGGGFGGTEDEGFAGILYELLQVTLAILALIALYLYIIASDQVTLFITDGIDFLLGKKGPRLRTIMYDIGRLYQAMNTRVSYDPYWLEKAIIMTPTLYDSPQKYERMLNISRPSRRTIKSSKGENDDYTDTDDKDNTNDEDSDIYNANNEDSDDDKAYRNKAYDDDDDDEYDDDDF